MKLIDAHAIARIRHYCLLAVLCTIMFLSVTSYLVLTHHGLLWTTDGISLYYAFFVSEGRAIRSAVAALLSGRLPQIGLYSFIVGYGADAYATMSGYLFDPFNLISALFPVRYAEYGFYLTMLLRTICAGWAFSAYCLNRGADERSSLVGSLCYVTCGFVLFLGLLRHPKFINFAIFIPLAMREADDLFAGRRRWVLPVIIGLAFASTPMFTYMLCLMMLGYCLIKYFFAPRKRSVLDFVRLVGSFLVRILLGFGLAAVHAIPVVSELLSLDRVTHSDRTVPMLYSIRHYLMFLPDLVGTNLSAKAQYLGVVPVFCAIVFLCAYKRIDERERRGWLVGLVCILVMMLVPWFGSAFNAFSYVTDRWMILCAFCLSYVLVLVVPVLEQLDGRDWQRITIVSCMVFTAACLISLAALKEDSLMLVFPFACYVVALFGLGSHGRRQTVGTLVVLLIASAAVRCIAYVGPVGTDHTDEFAGLGLAWETLSENVPARAAKEADIEEGYRYSQAGISNAVSNGQINLEVPGIDFSASISSDIVDEFRRGLEVANDNRSNHRYAGNDSRLALDLLTAARYFVASDAKAYRVPATYELTDAEANGFHVYKTPYAMPVAFSYSTSIAPDSYEALGPLQRQEALLQGCVIEDSSPINPIEPKSEDRARPFEMTASEDVIIGGDSFAVAKGGSKIEIATQGTAKSETYLRITDLRFEGSSKPDTAKLFNRSYSAGPRKRVLDALYTPPQATWIVVRTVLGERHINLPTPDDASWTGYDDLAINLGYSEEPIEAITVTFGDRGTYHFSSVSVECQPIAPVVEYATELQKGAAKKVSFGVDAVTAKLTASKDGSYAFFSIPYAKGWSATVDGVSADVLRANVGFMAVRMEGAGSHTVRLSYRTPGLFVGALVSLASLVMLVVSSHRRRRSERAGEGIAGPSGALGSLEEGSVS